MRFIPRLLMFSATLSISLGWMPIASAQESNAESGYRESAEAPLEEREQTETDSKENGGGRESVDENRESKPTATSYKTFIPFRTGSAARSGVQPRVIHDAPSSVTAVPPVAPAEVKTALQSHLETFFANGSVVRSVMASGGGRPGLPPPCSPEPSDQFSWFAGSGVRLECDVSEQRISTGDGTQWTAVSCRMIGPSSCTTVRPARAEEIRPLLGDATEGAYRVKWCATQSVAAKPVGPVIGQLRDCWQLPALLRESGELDIYFPEESYLHLTDPNLMNDSLSYDFGAPSFE